MGRGICATAESKVQPRAHYFRPKEVRGTGAVGLMGVIATTSLLSDVFGGVDGKAVALGLRQLGEGYYTRSPLMALNEGSGAI